MTNILSVLLALVVACGAQDFPSAFRNFEHEEVHDVEVLGAAPPPVHHPDLDNHEDESDEAIHPTTCLICCKHKSPKFMDNLCLDPKICLSKRCMKYMTKHRSSHRIRTSGSSQQRRIRTDEKLVPQEESQELCRSLYPMYSDIRISPVLDNPCSFTCVSQRSPPLPKRKSPNGWKCYGEPDGICWDGKCMDPAGPAEDDLCKEKLAKGNSMDNSVKAYVKLECQIACKTSAGDTVSYILRDDNPDCIPPDWLPVASPV